MISPIALSQLAETVATCAISVRSLTFFESRFSSSTIASTPCHDAALKRCRVRARGDVAQTFFIDGFREKVAVVVPSPAMSRRLGGDFANELRAHIFIRVFELDFFRDRHTVLGDRRAAEFLVENDVATARPEGGLDGSREFLDTAQQARAARFRRIVIV